MIPIAVNCHFIVYPSFIVDFAAVTVICLVIRCQTHHPGILGAKSPVSILFRSPTLHGATRPCPTRVTTSFSDCIASVIHLSGLSHLLRSSYLSQDCDDAFVTRSPPAPRICGLSRRIFSQIVLPITLVTGSATEKIMTHSVFTQILIPNQHSLII